MSQVIPIEGLCMELNLLYDFSKPDWQSGQQARTGKRGTLKAWHENDST